MRDVRYVRRRFLPAPGSSVALASHTVVEGDRLDNITARYLGDPTQFWRMCDANAAMNPPDLLRAGVTLLVPVPQA
ncbi:MAG: LysM peptidoglycan-binding domain-containing protein [Actinomycetota bacterium]|nr:LysM peptidoglycan-binding domain-containing protein [Actinomycetota bacterium]